MRMVLWAPCCKDEENETKEMLSNLPRVAQQISSRSRIQTQRARLQSLYFIDYLLYTLCWCSLHLLSYCSYFSSIQVRQFCWYLKQTFQKLAQIYLFLFLMGILYKFTLEFISLQQPYFSHGCSQIKKMLVSFADWYVFRGAGKIRGRLVIFYLFTRMF